jgi:putative lipoic acid-binding regulatory protein
MATENPEEFYNRLREELLKNSSWPSDYLFKFIIPSDKSKILRIHNIFDAAGAVIESKQSSKGKYTSISITINLQSPDEVIRKYKEVGKIEGVISL